MLSVAEAENTILSRALTPEGETVALADAPGRILAEDLVADRDFPPFDRVTMDGIAIRYEAWQKGRRQFAVQGVQAAGSPRLVLADASGCIEVMTGAMLPEGADTVIQYEHLDISDGVASLRTEAVRLRQNIHFRGVDRQAGATLIPRGTRVGPAEVAVAATVGKSRLTTARLPRAAIVSTGDELVPVEQIPLPHQIRGSNGYALQALLAGRFNLPGRIFHYPDDQLQIAAGLKAIFQEYRLVVLSGAVSAGKFDFVPQVLDDLGVIKHFHGVAQRPGKPFWFGTLPDGCAIFALPGNPVSAFTCACRYLLPFLSRSLGEKPSPPERAALSEAVVFKPALTYFLPVFVNSTPAGSLQAYPLPGHGSGDLANLTAADGFLELPADRDTFPAGEVFPFIRFRF